MNTITDLRAMLAETIRAVKSGTLEVDRAKTINDLCKTVVDTAKTEVDYCRVTGAVGSGFIDTARPESRPALNISTHIVPPTRIGRPLETEVTNPSPGVTRTVHRPK